MNKYSRPRLMRTIWKSCTLTATPVLLALSGTQISFAQDESEYSAEELEEIVVVAPRTFTSMRAEILRTEKLVLSIYNELNDEDDYDILCRNETPTGSHIPERVCRPVYVMRLEAQAAQDFMDTGSYTGPRENPAVHDRVLQQKLAEFAGANPGLLEALQDYYDAKTTYDQAREERFGSD